MLFLLFAYKPLSLFQPSFSLSSLAAWRCLQKKNTFLTLWKFHQWLCDCQIHRALFSLGPCFPSGLDPFLLQLTCLLIDSSLFDIACRLLCRNLFSLSLFILINYISLCLGIYFPCFCFLTRPSIIVWNSGKCRWFSNLFSQPRPLISRLIYSSA